MPKCHRKITICYLRGCVDSLLKRCGFTGPLESHFIDWLKIKMCILLISFPSLSYLLVRLKMGSYFKGFVFLWCFLHICDADGKHFMTFPFVCSRTIFLSFFSYGKRRKTISYRGRKAIRSCFRICICFSTNEGFRRVQA